MISKKKLAAILPVLVIVLHCLPATPQAIAQDQDNADQEIARALSLFDQLPENFLSDLAALEKGAMTGDPSVLGEFSNLILGALGPVPLLGTSEELKTLIEILLAVKEIYGQFSAFKSYWEDLYGSAKYLLSKNFWVANILDPLSSCLPSGSLFIDNPLDPFVIDMKEFLSFIAGKREYWQCSPELQNMLTRMIGGVPQIFDEDGNVVDAPASPLRTWQIYEAANNAPKEVAAARNAVPDIVTDAERLREAVISGENIPKNTAVAAGQILRAAASEMQLEATRVSLAAQEQVAELAAQKALEEANSASFEMFRIVPKVFVVRPPQEEP